MTFASDIADDQDIWDDVETETVTLRTRRTGGTETDFTIANARRLPLRRNEQTYSAIKLGDDAIRWNLKNNEVTATVSTTVVEIGDLILVGTVSSPSEVWKVEGVSKETFDTIWPCICVKQEA